jgi:hypothetical protein
LAGRDFIKEFELLNNLINNNNNHVSDYLRATVTDSGAAIYGDYIPAGNLSNVWFDADVNVNVNVEEKDLTIEISSHIPRK